MTGMLKPVRNAAVALLASIALIACSGGTPGEREVRAALKSATLANPTSKNNVFFRMFHDYTGDRAVFQDKAQISDLLDKPKIEVSACSAAGDAAGYYCEYRISWMGVLPLPANVTIPEWSDWHKGRFFEAGGQWQLDNGR